MSITIDVNNMQLKGNESVLNMHFLPAAIKGDGEAAVENYFDKYTSKEHGILVNSLRGFPLHGEKRSVPVGYKGIVLQETAKPLNMDTDRILRVKGTFEDFIYWNYDKVPSASDGYQQSLQILDVASKLAEVVSEADVLMELKSK